MQEIDGTKWTLNCDECFYQIVGADTAKCPECGRELSKVPNDLPSIVYDQVAMAERSLAGKVLAVFITSFIVCVNADVGVLPVALLVFVFTTQAFLVNGSSNITWDWLNTSFLSVFAVSTLCGLGTWIMPGLRTKLVLAWIACAGFTCIAVACLSTWFMGDRPFGIATGIPFGIAIAFFVRYSVHCYRIAFRRMVFA